MGAAKKNLVIVESPSKAKTIGKYLGSKYKVKTILNPNIYRYAAKATS